MGQDTTDATPGANEKNSTFEKFKKKIRETKKLQNDEKDQASKRSRRDQFEDKDRENRPSTISRAKSEYQPRNLDTSEIRSKSCSIRQSRSPENHHY